MTSLQLSQVGVKGQVLDLPLSLVADIVRLERHAIIAHPLGTMAAHLFISFALDLAILRAPEIVDGILLDLGNGRRGNN